MSASPGPWKVKEVVAGSIFHVRDAKGGFVVEVELLQSATAENATTVRDDLDLIAAAPALRDALESALAMMRADGWDDASTAPMRAALAKARGE
jgi:hypothetical protein